MTQTRAPREIRVRTCIATRERKPDIELLRVVLDPRDPTRLLADPGRRLPGRGAWITPDVTALELAEQRRAFGRAFRVSGTSLDTGHVRTYLAATAAGPDITRKTEH
ncbi:YlxR family protein [Corynebacterium sp.]|uniref:YlxR family protein n=1 Tax=Corynebacterium sp. TaxID=1720 RepID=UPI00199CDA8F|nr:YlxR family protein [Corynebacterium sp.]HHU68513.1 YlxR family protein [Corynebacterium sp.]